MRVSVSVSVCVCVANLQKLPNPSLPLVLAPVRLALGRLRHRLAYTTRALGHTLCVMCVCVCVCVCMCNRMHVRVTLCVTLCVQLCVCA